VNDREVSAGAVIAAADYHHVDRQLLPAGHGMYSGHYWNTRKMSPSSLIFYIGGKQETKEPPASQSFFDEDFSRHAEEIYEQPKFPARPLFYVCCPSQTDESVAPEGKENLFLLMPLAAGLSDSTEMREKYYRIMIERIQRLTGEDFENDIVFKQSLLP
jgi:phytoene desaturase